MLRDHHDAFQLRFKKTEDKYVQFYESNRDEVVLNTLDIQSLGREDQLNDVLTKWQSGFNIENGPTFCVGYLHGYDDGSARVWFAMHHLIVDSVSWRIICQDLQTLYNGGSLGQKGSSYRQWAQAVQDYSYSEAEKLYWNHLVEDASSFNQKLISTNKVSHHTSFTLTADETKSLLRNCHQAYDTQINDLLLSALGYALQETTRSHINYVTLEGHGREDIDSTLNISSTVGWFTTLYPVVLEIGDDLGSSISNIKECLRQVPNKGIGYGTIFGYLEKALPQVSFNYLGQFDQGTSATGFWSLVDVTGEYGLDRSDSSEEANDNVIDVTGLCFNGHMCFNIASHLSLEETERFKAVFKMKLEQIIEHTLSFVHPQKDIKESTSTGMAVDHFEPYFEFHNPPGGAVLFILPPGEGGAESYFNNIVQQLTQFKLVLFNNYYLHLKSPQTSFEELAKFYISYVKQIQPKGPYNFLGWSFGGLLSLEISRQLVGAGEKIDNLIFIDSYFNVKKACSDINQADEVDIIDRINYFYSPKEADMKQLVSNTRNIVLFKAAKLNDTYRSDNQLLLFDYYMKSDFNNLDTLMDPQSIQLFHLADDTHASWVKNEHQVTSMCNSISSKLKQAVGK
uniref:oleoyl-[acyl-carrier-protein] hydrolase n=1 Tax=Plectus sambesii TaxID=2011161 RepID=A0A914XN27_9BILA